jgi:hypothetical protein
LPPGLYFVRARAPDALYEGMLDAAMGSSRAVDTSKLERIAYARLVRKGMAQRAHGPFAGVSVRTPLPNANRACLGGFGGYQVDVSRFGARAQVGACQSELQNAALHATVLGYDVRAAGYHAWDLGAVALEIGLGAGLTLFHQQFETRGKAPAQRALALFTALHVGADLHLSRGFYLALQASGETHFMRIRQRAPRETLRVGFAVRPSLSFGKQF